MITPKIEEKIRKYATKESREGIMYLLSLRIMMEFIIRITAPIMTDKMFAALRSCGLDEKHITNEVIENLNYDDCHYLALIPDILTSVNLIELFARKCFENHCHSAIQSLKNNKVFTYYVNCEFLYGSPISTHIFASFYEHYIMLDKLYEIDPGNEYWKLGIGCNKRTIPWKYASKLYSYDELTYIMLKYDRFDFVDNGLCEDIWVASDTPNISLQLYKYIRSKAIKDQKCSSYIYFSLLLQYGDEAFDFLKTDEIFLQKRESFYFYLIAARKSCSYEVINFLLTNAGPSMKIFKVRSEKYRDYYTQKIQKYISGANNRHRKCYRIFAMIFLVTDNYLVYRGDHFSNVDRFFYIMSGLNLEQHKLIVRCITSIYPKKIRNIDLLRELA